MEILEEGRKAKRMAGFMYYQELINDFVAVCNRTLGNQLTGIYLHGSLAMGCFNSNSSDIDIIVIVESSISAIQKMSLMKQIVRLNRSAPAKGLEISFVKKEYCKPFIYPTPFELHFSPMHLQWFNDNPKDYIDKMNGEDKDLAAHFTIINKYGIILWGKEISAIFDDVPCKDYIDSICHDVKNAAQDILDNPVYVTLNLCRVLAYLRNGLILSKEEGGKWGIIHLEERYTPLIFQAQQCYKYNGAMQIDKNTSQQFADAMLKDIRYELEKLHISSLKLPN